ncbi:putative secreted protein (Por secretion system target) [Breznakibacter xylanolyticus]|uniref:Putative secreted protein (Por secretion system target) n=1 Tax=Breznakibacter xylanolyticus TaxID=990 RepID=A0A2W7Q3F3_9BACT|nr:BACON domain-containing carbohydrate-binding protein [Breznakibacter xylanolyticus]PZX16159.1 putative secreted protein (Por secretion system target) [Breznakibacter xylanolyticus]
MKTLSILLLCFVSIYLTGNAQSFTPIAGSGFNYDAIANSSGTGASSITQPLMPGVCFYAKDFQSTLNPIAPPLGLPMDGVIVSTYRPEISFQLRDYSQPNVLLVGLDNDHETFRFNTPTPYATLALLMTNNYPSSVCVEVNFADQTRLFYNFNTKAWNNTSNPALKGCGALNPTTDQYLGTADDYNLFDYLLAIPDTAKNKNIVSVRFSKSDIGSKLYVLALSGSNSSPYTGYAPTPVLEGNVTVDAPVKYTDAGGEWFCYPNGTTHKTTFIPADPTKKIRLNFDFFQTFCVYDIMKIYNGKETDPAKLIAQYYISITNDQKEVIATNPDGALTCVYTTNTFYPHLGWNATVSQITLHTNDLKALSLRPLSTTPPNDEAIAVYLKLRNYSTSPVKGADYNILFTAPDGTELAKVAGKDIEPGIIDSVAASILFANPMQVKATIDYPADLNPADNATSFTAIAPMPQIKMGNATATIDNREFLFFDEGGINFNYSNATNYTLTLRPDKAGHAVRIRFTMLATEANYDFISIYNSATANPSALMANVAQDDGKVPDILKSITASNDDGALTIVFTSDNGVTRKGWEALVDRISTLTPDSPPTVVTLAAINVTETSAMLRGTLTATGQPNSVVRGFCFSTTNPEPTLTDSRIDMDATTATGDYASPIDQLVAGTTYHVRAYATNSTGTAYGATTSFITPILSVSSNTVTIEGEGGTAPIELTANTAWASSIPADWLSLSPSSGNENTTLTISAAANPLTILRSVTITLQASGVASKNIVVTQLAGAPTLAIATTTNLLESIGGQSTINVVSNTTWSVASDEEWLHADANSGNGTSSFTITATDNPGVSQRSGTITVTADGVADQSIVITQQGATPTLMVQPPTANLPAEGGTTSLLITSNTNWMAATATPWMSITPATGDQNGIATITTTANTAPEERSGVITFTAPDITPVQVIITQNAQGVIFSISPQTLSLPSSAGTASLVITSNTPWTLTSDAPWLTPDTENGTGNATLMLTHLANPLAQSRTASCTILANGVMPQTVVITQEAAAIILSSTTTSLTLNAEEDNQTIDIMCNADWVAHTTADWLSLSPQAGSGNGTLILSTLNNPSTEDRQTTVTIMVDDDHQVALSIMQTGSPATLEVSHPSIVFDADGGSQTIQITSNTDWQLTPPEQEWLRIWVMKSSEGSISVSAPVNPTHEERTVTLTLITTSGELMRTITVTQAPGESTDNAATEASPAWHIDYCNDTQTIRLHNVDGPVTLTDLTGRIIMTEQINGEKNISTQNMKRGIYLVQWNDKTIKMVIR